MRWNVPFDYFICIVLLFLSACSGGSGGGSATIDSATLVEMDTAPTGLAATPVEDEQIDLTWDSTPSEQDLASYSVYRNGIQVASTDETRYSDTQLFAGTLFSYQIAAVNSEGTQSPLSDPVEAMTGPFNVTDVQVGDPSVSYANVEFTRDGRYMVWFEQTTNGNGLGTVWHCSVDPDSGELVPAHGKGFRAFDSTAWGRANPGTDAQGPYYVGMNRSGDLVMVRPSAPDQGTVTILPTSQDTVRRAIYPSDIPNEQKGFVFWIRNETVPGNILDSRNTWFDLRYIDLDAPGNEITIERQGRSRFDFPGMDVGFARWFRGKASLTYGFFDENSDVQIREFLPGNGDPGPFEVTSDSGSKIDPFPFTFENQDILLPGLDAQPTTAVYVRDIGTQFFTLQETVTPGDTSLQNPSLAQSNQPIEFDARSYTAFQINESGSDFLDTAFAQTGEIWLSTVLQSKQEQWRLSAVNDMAKAEPEPYVGSSKIWVFYSAAPEGSDLLRATWTLRRAETPIGFR